MTYTTQIHFQRQRTLGKAPHLPLFISFWLTSTLKTSWNIEGMETTEHELFLRAFRMK